MQAVPTQSGPQRGQNGNSPRHRSTELNLASLAGSQLEKVGPMPGNELLVRGDDRFPRPQSAPHNLFGRIETADQLDNDLHIRI